MIPARDGAARGVVGPGVAGHGVGPADGHGDAPWTVAGRTGDPHPSRGGCNFMGVWFFSSFSSLWFFLCSFVCSPFPPQVFPAGCGTWWNGRVRLFLFPAAGVPRRFWDLVERKSPARGLVPTS